MQLRSNRPSLHHPPTLPTPLGGLVEHVSEILGALVGDLDRDMIGVSSKSSGQTVVLARGELLSPVAEDVPHLRVSLVHVVAPDQKPQLGRTTSGESVA